MSGPARSSRRRVAAGFRSRRRLEISSLDDEDADAMRATRRETRRVSTDPRDAARDARAGEGIGTRREGMYRDGSVRARRDVSSRAEVGTHAGLFLRSVRIGDIRFRGNSSASSPAASAPRAGGSFARTRTMPPAPIAAPNAAALESEGSSSCSDDDGSRSVGGSSSEDESSSGSSRSAFRDALAIANDPSRAEPVLVDVGSGAGRLLLAAATMRCVL